MDYLTIFKESMSIFWRHKILWVFGVLVTLFGQGEYSFSVSYRQSYSFDQNGAQVFPAIPGSQWILEFMKNPWPYLIGFFLLSLVLWIVTSLVCWWLQAGMISMVDEVGQKSATSIGSGLRAGKRRAVPLTLMAVLLGAPTAVINLPAILGGVWLFMQFKDLLLAAASGEVISPGEVETLMNPVVSSLMLVFACTVPLFCLTVILGWLLGLLNKIAARSLVLENLSILGSIKRGWQLMKKHFGYVLLNGIMLVVLGVIFAGIAAIPALVLWVPLASGILQQTWTTSTVLMAVLFGIYYLLVAVALGGTLTSFNSILWTRFYRAMQTAASPATEAF